MNSTALRPFLSIREASNLTGEPQHVLRFWERNISGLRPVKRAGGRRYYRESDILLLKGIQLLVRRDGLTIRGVNRYLREHGATAAMEIARGASHSPAATQREKLLAAAEALRACARMLREGTGESADATGDAQQ